MFFSNGAFFELSRTHRGPKESEVTYVYMDLLWSYNTGRNTLLRSWPGRHMYVRQNKKKGRKNVNGARQKDEWRKTEKENPRDKLARERTMRIYSAHGILGIHSEN